MDIEQLGIYTVKLRHKDKSMKCRFFLVYGEGPALLGMPDIKLLNILSIMCEVISKPPESRMFHSQTKDSSSSPSCITNRTLWNATDKAGTHDNNTNMPYYFRFSAKYIMSSAVFFQE